MPVGSRLVRIWCAIVLYLGCASSRGSDRVGSRPGEARGGGKLGRARQGEQREVACTRLLGCSAPFDAFPTRPEVGDGSNRSRKTSGVGGWPVGVQSAASTMLKRKDREREEVRREKKKRKKKEEGMF